MKSARVGEAYHGHKLTLTLTKKRAMQASRMRRSIGLQRGPVIGKIWDSARLLDRYERK